MRSTGHGVHPYRSIRSHASCSYRATVRCQSGARSATTAAQRADHGFRRAAANSFSYSAGFFVYGANRCKSAADSRGAHSGNCSSAAPSIFDSTVATTTSTARGFSPSSSARDACNSTPSGNAPR